MGNDPDGDNKMFQLFKEVHRKHPVLWHLFRYFALQIIAAGRDRTSATMIFERMRWDTNVVSQLQPGQEVVTRSGERALVLLNNNMHPYFARYFDYHYREQYPGLFAFRKVGPNGEEPDMGACYALVDDEDFIK